MRPTSRKLRFSRIAGMLIFIGSLFTGATAWTADIRGIQSGRWTLAASPYIVTGDIIIPAGMSLAIEPGVMVKFAGPYKLRVEGSLQAVGAPSNRVIFTSINDSEFGFGTNPQNPPTINDWMGIEFANSIDKNNCRLENVIIRYSNRPIEVGKALPSALTGIVIMDSGSNVVRIKTRIIPIRVGKDQNFLVNFSNNAATKTVSRQPEIGRKAPAAAVAATVFAAKDTIPPTKSVTLVSDDDDEFSFGEMTVITASRREERVSDAPAIIDVITADQIRNTGAQTLEDVVKFLPGIQTPISRKGHSRLWIRGMGARYNNKSLLLINGSPMRRLWFGHHPLDDEFLLENVERIEVIRGPGSAVYGANALVGVINVITKDPKINYTQIDAIGGNKKTGKLGLKFGRNAEMGSVGGSFTFFDTQGDFIDRDKYTHVNSKFDARRTVSMQTAAELGKFSASAFFSKYNSQYRTEVFNEEIDYDKTQFYGTFAYENAFSDQFSLSWKNYFNRFDWVQTDVGFEDIITQGVAENADNRLVWDVNRTFKSQILGSDVIATWTPAKSNTFVVGLNFEQERLRDFGEVTRFNWYEDNIIFSSDADRADVIDDYSGDFGAVFDTYELLVDNDKDGLVDDTLYVLQPQLGGSTTESVNSILPITNNNIAAYLQNTWQANDFLTLIAGFRFDNHETYGSSFSPRGGLILHPSRKSSIKLLYNRAFRAPAYFELYLQRADNDNPGNINLKPEIIQAFDLEANIEPLRNASAKLGLFYEEISDFITAVGSDTIRNIGARRSVGVELGLNYRLAPDVTFFANASYIDVMDIGAQVFDLVWKTPEENKSKYSLVPTDEFRDIEVPSVAPILVNLGVNFGNWRYANFNVNMHYEGRRNRPVDYHANIRKKYGQNEFFLQDNLGGYAVANLAIVSKNFFAPWEFSLIVRNLLDTTLYNPPYEPAKYFDIRRNRRSFQLKASYQLN